MGLFPETSSSGNSTAGANISADTSDSSTPNVRRRLFSAASEMLASVGSSKNSSGRAGAFMNDKLADSITSTSPTTKITTSTNPSSSSSMQQLSTSWEFLRLVAQIYTIFVFLQLNSCRHWNHHRCTGFHILFLCSVGFYVGVREVVRVLNKSTSQHKHLSSNECLVSILLM